MIVNNSYGPLINSLPLSLADRSYSAGAHGKQDDAEGHENEHEGVQPSVATPLIGDEEKGQIRFADQQRPISTASTTATTDNKARRRSAFSSLHDRVRGRHGKNELTNSKGTAPGSLDDKIPTDFSHPATFEPQREIWLPYDRHGCGEEERHLNTMQGITAVCDKEFAVMDEKGHVNALRRTPPGFEKKPDTLDNPTE